MKSGLAGIEMEEEFLRDGIVELAAGRAVGVNGLNLGDCSVSDGTIRFGLSSPFERKRPPVLVFRPVTPDRRYRIYVNGREAGSWLGEELAKGIPLE